MLPNPTLVTISVDGCTCAAWSVRYASERGGCGFGAAELPLVPEAGQAAAAVRRPHYVLRCERAAVFMRV